MSIVATEIFHGKVKGTSSGEYYVYLWKHKDGEVYYVGSGKGTRATDTVARNTDFKKEYENGDSVVYYLVRDVSMSCARLVEHYVSYRLSLGGVALTNKDYNVAYMDKEQITVAKVLTQKSFCKEIDNRLSQITKIGKISKGKSEAKPPRIIIKEAMINRGVSQQKLANKIGLSSQQGLLSMINAKKGMRADNFARIMNALGYDVIAVSRATGDEITLTPQ